MNEQERRRLTMRRPVREAAQRLAAMGDFAGAVELFSRGFRDTQQPETRQQTPHTVKVKKK